MKDKTKDVCEIMGCNREAFFISKIDRVMVCEKHNKGLTWDIRTAQEVLKEVLEFIKSIDDNLKCNVTDLNCRYAIGDMKCEVRKWLEEKQKKAGVEMKEMICITDKRKPKEVTIPYVIPARAWVSLCPFCNCMTHTVKRRCGKCGKEKRN